jgi:hypothetical protein
MGSVTRGRIVVDSSLFPLVIERFGRDVSDEDIESMIRKFQVMLHGGRRYALLVYCEENANVMGARQRRRVSDWYREVADQVRRINVGTAVVIESSMVRGAMTALNWLIEPIAQQRNVANLHEGIDYCIRCLEGAQIQVPHEVIALRDMPERRLKRLG